MWAHIECRGLCEQQCSGVIRVFDDGLEFHKDAYRCAIKFTKLGAREIELVGMTKPVPTKEEWQAVKEACQKAGLKVYVERLSGCKQGRRRIGEND